MGRKGYCVDPFKLHKRRVFRFIGSVSSDLAGIYGLKKGTKICNNCRSHLAKVKGQPEPRQALNSSTSISSEDEISCPPSTSGAPIPVTRNGMSTDDEESEVTLQQVLPMLHETPVKLCEFILRV